MTSPRASGGDLWVRVSPQGKRAGFVSIPMGKSSLSLTVLPKPWASTRTRAARVRELTWIGEASVHLTAYELDYIRVRGAEHDLAQISWKWSRATADQTGEEPFLSIARPPERTEDSADEPATQETGLAGLIDLLGLANRAQVRFDSGGNGSASDEVVLRLLLFERFLAALAEQLPNARPNYSARSEVLTSPRGRLVDADLAMAVRERRPWVLCNFDEHSMDTPLLQVMLAAVSVVSTTVLPRGLQHLGANQAARAARLARHLTAVSLLPRPEAVRVSRRIWLNHFERPWTEALRLATQVLEQSSHLPQQGLEADRSLALTIATEKLWERMLLQVLKRATSDVRVSADNVAARGVVVPVPWTPMRGGRTPGGRYPDFVARVDDRVVVLDAKYKFLDGGLIAGDDYQLFAYSHLTQLDGDPVEAAAVLGVTTPNRATGSARFVRAPHGDMPLVAVSLPFPSREGIRTASSWERYLTCTAANLGRALSPLI
ncbi:5-methylcytosine restriction system specificity protein McrC [Modestobacter sp. URMC 112]